MSQTKVGNYVKQTPLMSLELEVIQSCLLGDGTLSQSGKHYRLRIEHSSRHWQYVRWKYNLLKRLCLSEIQYIPTHNSLRFGTIGHPEITELRHIWYQPIKQIPSGLALTPLMVSIWFMDDGTKHRDTIDISVHNFSDDDLQIPRDQLLRQFNIQTTVNSDSKGCRLYVVKKSYPNFKKLVKPYIVECMAYKLP